MIDDEKTPVDPTTPIEMLLNEVKAVGADARDAKEYARRTNDLQLVLNESHKQLRERLERLERVHVVLPALSIVLTVAVCALVALLHW